MELENISTTVVNDLTKTPISEMKMLPDIGCVYFIFSNGELLYVGSTNSLLKRIQSHHRLRQFLLYDAAEIGWIESTSGVERKEWEQHFISTLNPPLNNSRVEAFGRPTRGMVGELIMCWRKKHNLGLREAARMINIAPMTLSRIERGLDYDSRTLLMVQRWLFGNGD